MTDLEISIDGKKVYLDTDEAIANVRNAEKEENLNIAAHQLLAASLGTPLEWSSDDIKVHIPLTMAEQSNT